MIKKDKNCFYCQKLGAAFLLGKCDFCGKRNSNHNSPLYPVIYRNKPKNFCCCCAWWNSPRNETEKKEERIWWQKNIVAK